MFIHFRTSSLSLCQPLSVSECVGVECDGASRKENSVCPSVTTKSTLPCALQALVEVPDRGISGDKAPLFQSRKLAGVFFEAADLLVNKDYDLQIQKPFQ